MTDTLSNKAAEIVAQARAAASKVDGWSPELASILCDAEREIRGLEGGEPSRTKRCDCGDKACDWGCLHEASLRTAHATSQGNLGAAASEIHRAQDLLCDDVEPSDAALAYEALDRALSALRTTHSPSEAEVEAAARYVLENSRRGNAPLSQEQFDADTYKLMDCYRDIITKALESGALSLPSDKTRRACVGEAYGALTYIAEASECEQSRKAAAEALASIDSHLGEMK